MGIFGFVANIASSAVKVAVGAPLAVWKDIIEEESLTNTTDLLSSALDDLNSASDEIL